MNEKLERSFEARCAAAHGAVWHIIRQRNPDDPHLVWADVCLKAWRHYPRMYAEECAALAAGEASPHDWTAWLITIAVRHLIDVHRKKHGRRCPAGERNAADRPRTVGWDSVTLLPLNTAVIAAPPESDPYVRLALSETWQEMNHALAALTRDERLSLLDVVVDGVKEAEIAARLGTSRRTVRRRRRHAIASVRERLNACGLDRARYFRVAA